MKRMVLVATILTMMLAGLSQAASDDQKAAVLLQAAQVKETIQGDLKGAIALYQQAADEAKTNRPVAAKALLALGMAYQKLAIGDARAVFERVVREFGDQKEAVLAARTRLAAFAPAAATPQSDTTTPRRVASIDTGSIQAVSSDGSLVAVGQGNDLVIRSALDGQVTFRLIGSALGRAGRTVFSRDGRAIAYTWFATSDATNRQSLRVITTEHGSMPRTLLTGSPFGADWNAVTSADVREIVTPVGWSADGGAILTELHPLKILSFTSSMGLPGSQFAWVSVLDGSVRTVKAFQAPRLVEAGSARLSADGRFVAYPSDLYSSESRIVVLDLTTGSEVDVVKVAGRNFQPIWTPDSSSLLFTSDRSGSAALWSVPVLDGRATSEPIMVKSGFAKPLLGISISGSLYYAEQTFAERTILIADRGPAGSARVVQTLPGDFAINWSPDGKWITFARNSKRPGDGDVILRSVRTGEERLYQHDGLAKASVRWFHDGSGFLARIGDVNAASDCFVDIASHEFKPCHPRNAPNRPRGAAWMAPDDKTGYAIGGPAEGARWSEIHAMDPLTGATKSIVSLPVPFGGPVGMSVNPDGVRLALFGFIDGKRDKARLVTIRVDGTDYRELLLASAPRDGAISDIVTWTPDGREIVFATGEPNGGWRAMRISGDGGKPEVELDPAKLTGTVAFPRETSVNNMVLSADGLQIAWGGYTPSSSELWAIDNIASLLGRH